MRSQLILSALLIGCSSLVAAFSKGAPICAADAAAIATPKSMGAQVDFGYTVASADLAKGYTPGGKAVQVVVGGAKTFKGILVYAVDAAKNHVGSFELPKGLQYKTGCQGDDAKGSGTLTHADATDKAKMTLLWTPPAKSAGPIMFVSTFVSGGPKSLNPGFQIAKSVSYADTSAPGKTPPATDSAAPKSTNVANPAPPTGSTPTPSPTTPANTQSAGISISQYSSFGALVLANVVAAVILL